MGFVTCRYYGRRTPVFKGNKLVDRPVLALRCSGGNNPHHLLPNVRPLATNDGFTPPDCCARFLRDELAVLATHQEEMTKQAQQMGCTRFEPMEKV